MFKEYMAFYDWTKGDHDIHAPLVKSENTLYPGGKQRNVHQ